MDAYNHLRINNLKWVFENENRFYQKLFKHCKFFFGNKAEITIYMFSGIDCHGMLVKLTCSKYRYFLTIKIKTL